MEEEYFTRGGQRVPKPQSKSELRVDKGNQKIIKYLYKHLRSERHTGI